MMSLTVLAALAAFVFSVPAQLAPQMPNDPAENRASGCLSEGDSDGFCVSMKVPTDWGASATAEEVDPFSNDPLGAPFLFSPRPGFVSACITITNKSGELVGPNGEVQTGGGEGDCIEVDLTLIVTSPRTVGFTLPLGYGGATYVGIAEDEVTESQTFCAC